MLPDPTNGMYSCSLGDDGVLSYEDICTLTCNTNYEVDGDEIRICQSDGTWNGTDFTCRRSKCLV